MTVRAVIADDEPLARQKLRAFLDEVDWIECAGEATDGPATVALVERTRPDLLFLDVRMPGHDGMEVLARLRHRPAVVFTTAYDEYAVTAFELRALDYLLKPFGRRRFLAALQRVRGSLAFHADVPAVERGLDALAPDRPLRRIFVRTQNRIVPVTVADVTRFEACDDYVAIHTRAARHLAGMRLGDLERMLDRDRFVRIHRSHIVNLDAVREIVPHESGRLLVRMRDGTEVFASRARSRVLRRRVL